MGTKTLKYIIHNAQTLRRSFRKTSSFAIWFPIGLWHTILGEQLGLLESYDNEVP